MCPPLALTVPTIAVVSGTALSAFASVFAITASPQGQLGAATCDQPDTPPVNVGNVVLTSAGTLQVPLTPNTVGTFTLCVRFRGGGNSVTAAPGNIAALSCVGRAVECV